jgi:hypothetical protein
MMTPKLVVMCERAHLARLDYPFEPGGVSAQRIDAQLSHQMPNNYFASADHHVTGVSRARSRIFDRKIVEPQRQWIRKLRDVLISHSCVTAASARISYRSPVACEVAQHAARDSGASGAKNTTVLRLAY